MRSEDRKRKAQKKQKTQTQQSTRSTKKLRIPQSPNLYADHVETLIDDATPKKQTL